MSGANRPIQTRARTIARAFVAWATGAAGAVALVGGSMGTAAGAATIPTTFDPQGPAPITGGQVEKVTPNNEVAGAVHTVVAHPDDADVLWIGTVNGGVWRTTNATAASPTWTPLTDDQDGLSIGALELDPTVATNTVLLAGNGRVSSFGRINSPLSGLLRSADAGTTWQPIGDDDLDGESISGIAPRGQAIVVSTNGNTNALGTGQGGIWRSTDGGASFTRLSGNGTSGLPGFGVFDLVSDPSDPTRLWAGGQDAVYLSTDTGATWTDVSGAGAGTPSAAISVANTNNLELNVQQIGGTNVVFVGVVNNGQLAGLFRSTDQGANWTQLDTPQTNEGGTNVGINPRPKPGGQGGVHFSIVGDNADANVVYVGGDRQPNNNGFPNSIGANDFSGRLFRCDASLAAGSQCAPITHNGTANNSAPHADSREMVWDANGDMIETDDGGVYRQSDPATANGAWVSLNGNLQIAEHHSCAYDSVGDLVLCGNQDTGAPEQSASGSTTWTTLSAGDGGFVAVDDSGADSIRYSSSNSLGAGSFLRRTCDAANSCANSAPSFNVVGQGQTIQAFDALPLYTPLVMNDVDPSRFIVTSNRVYESTDQLDNLNIIVNTLGTNGAGNSVLTTRAIAYGGRSGGADNAGVLWYGTNAGALFLRSSGGGTPSQVAGWTFGSASDIVLDPENWAVAYVSAGSSVYRTTDAGATFTDITGDLGSAAPNASVRSLEIIPIAGTDELALVAGTDSGLYVTQTQVLGTWAEVGDGLPNTVAFDLEYDAADDLLLVATMGRGAWLVNDASELLPVADLRVTKSDSPDPVKAGEELFYTVTVANDGPDDALGITVIDDLPDEVIYLSDDGGCTYDDTEHQLTCPIGDLADGQARSFRIKTLVQPDTVVDEDDGTLNIENVVTVTSLSIDPDSSDNTETEITFVQESADLRVTKLCKPDDDLRAGETGTCTIFVDNVGPSYARDVVLRDTHVSDGDFTFGTITPSQGTCSPPAGGVVTCQLGDLAAMSATEEGRATVTIELSATEDVDINDTAVATSPTPDPNTADNQAEGHLSVMAVTDLSITKSGPPTAVAGTNVVYELSIENDGPSTAEGVVVEDLLPAGVAVVSIAAPGGTCNAGVPGDSTQPSTCSFGTLAPGATRTMTIEVHVLPDTLGIVHNDARVASQTFDDDTSDNLATVATDVAADADLSISKVDSPDPVVAGNPLTYTVEVTNDGPSTAQDVEITDTLPTGTSFVEGIDGNGATVCALVQVGTVVCELGTLQPGESVTVYITVTVDPSVPDGTILHNEAEVTSSTPDSDPSDNQTSADTLVTTSAEVWLDKTATLRSGNPAPVIEFTLVVHNDSGCETDAQSSPTPTCGAGGPSDAQGTQVIDELPLTSKKLVVQYVSPQCSYDESAHTVTCDAGPLPAGETVTFVIEVQANGSVGTITNSATLTTQTDDPDLSNNTDSATIVVKGGTGKRK